LMNPGTYDQAAIGSNPIVYQSAGGPTLSMPAARFSGSNTLMRGGGFAINAPQPFTLLAVCSIDVPAPLDDAMFQVVNGGTKAKFGFRSNGDLYLYAGATSADSPTGLQGAWHALAGVYNAASSEIWGDGSLRAGHGTNIGSGAFTSGDLYMTDGFVPMSL